MSRVIGKDAAEKKKEHEGQGCQRLYNLRSHGVRRTEKSPTTPLRTGVPREGEQIGSHAPGRRRFKEQGGYGKRQRGTEKEGKPIKKRTPKIPSLYAQHNVMN